MSLEMESARRAAADLLPGLVSHVWVSSVFLLAVLAILALLRRRLTAGARFSLVLVGLAKFALPHAVVAAGVQALGRALRLDSRGPLETPLRAIAGAFRVDFAPSATRLWPALVLGLWAAVALLLILRLARAHYRLASVWTRTALPPRPRETAALERARRRTGVHGRVGIARSPLPQAPAVVGVLRPLILLPLAGCDGLSDDELESLLRHECAHVARRDNLVAGCVSVLCFLFWFHPLVWIARRILILERERACDEIAVGSGEGRETYLTALAKFCHAAIAPELPGISRMATAQLKKRMDHIMRYPSLKAQSPSPARTALLAATALALFTVASGLVGSGPLAFAEVPAPSSGPSPRAEAITVQPAVLPAPTPTRDASRPQPAPSEGKTAQQPRHSAVVTVDTGSEAPLGTAEPASSGSRRPNNCPFIDCLITCDNGLSRTQHFADTLSCYSYSDSAGCRGTGLFVCSDKPSTADC